MNSARLNLANRGMPQDAKHEAERSPEGNVIELEPTHEGH